MTILPDSSILSMSVEELHTYQKVYDHNVVAVIPAYNEERFIGSIVIQTNKLVNTVIVVDDGSNDETATIASDAGASVIQLGENQGKGKALNVGFKKALELKPDVVVTLDADGQHLPSELPSLVLPILNDEADFVIGSRYLEDKSQVPKHRIWGHKLFNMVTKATSGTGATDSQSGYRAFSPRALEKIFFSSAGFSVESEMQFIAKEYGLQVKEVPITIYYKDAPKRSVWKHGLNVLGGILKLAGQYRPLVFIGLPGALTLLLGFGWGLHVVEIFRRKSTLPAGYAMISVLLSVIGTLGLSTGVILHSIRGLLVEFGKKNGGK